MSPVCRTLSWRQRRMVINKQPSSCMHSQEELIFSRSATVAVWHEDIYAARAMRGGYFGGRGGCEAKRSTVGWVTDL